MFSFFQHSNSSTESENATRARELAKQIGPRIYELTTKQSRYLLTGCGGDGGAGQKNVAEAIYQRIREESQTKPESKPDYLFLLGDNFYDNGVDSPESSAFRTKFIDIYNKLFCDFGIKVIAILGNHDLNLSEASRYTADEKKGRHIGLNQRARSLLPEHSSQTLDERFKLLQGKAEQQPVKLQQRDLPTFFMPWNFFGIHTADNKAIFCLDSNMLCEDALFYLAQQTSSDPLANPNQLAWLIDNYKIAKEAGKDIIFLTHHPVMHDSHQRHDTNHYLTPNQIQLLAQLLGTTNISHSHLLKTIFERYGLEGVFFNAHNHFMEIFDNQKNIQFTLGGGGGALQKRRSFVEHPTVKCHYDDFGYAILADETVILQPLSAPAVTYHVKEHGFLRHKASQNGDFIALRNAVLTACDLLFRQLQKFEQPNTHTINLESIQPVDTTQLSITKRDPGYLYHLSQSIFKATHMATKYLTKDTLKETEIQVAQFLIGFCHQPTDPTLAEFIRTLREKIVIIEKLMTTERPSLLYQFLKQECSQLESGYTSMLFDDQKDKPTHSSHQQLIS
jgi:predicted MPP superfamily phosphohydrolase